MSEPRLKIGEREEYLSLVWFLQKITIDFFFKPAIITLVPMTTEYSKLSLYQLSYAPFLSWGRYGFDRDSSSLGCESRGSASLKRQSL